MTAHPVKVSDPEGETPHGPVQSNPGTLAKGDVILAVDNVSLSFGGVKAIRDVSFDIRKGEIRAIIGPNGAGKTSMLNVINGFYHPQQGIITYKGQRRTAMRPYIAASQGRPSACGSISSCSF